MQNRLTENDHGVKPLAPGTLGDVSLDPAGPAASAPAPAASPPSTLDPQPPYASFSGETARASEAFRVYLALGPQRRYAAVARKAGVSLRTVERWAASYDGRGRILECATRDTVQYPETRRAVQRQECRDAAARDREFEERQRAVAEALLEAAERYLERLAGADLDLMNFGDVGKGLEVASRIDQERRARQAGTADAPARSLNDQLSALLEKVCPDTPRFPSLRRKGSCEPGKKCRSDRPIRKTGKEKVKKR